MGPSEPNVENRTLFEHDNLPVMRGINSETIDLIATDPPFNKGRDFHATPDSLAKGASFQDRWRWEEDVQTEWVDAIRDSEPGAWAVIDWTRMTYGDDMGAFLCFVGVRLLEMRRLLKPAGSIYLHCDDTASAYLKTLMDAIFGRQNFRNTIKWCYTGPSVAKRWFPRKSDTILFYAKSEASTFNSQRKPHKSGIHNNGTVFGKIDGDAEQMRQREVDGKLVEDWWDEFGAGAHIAKGERTGYPTQKPLALYDRIIRASSNAGDWVLDPFAGCATTPLAAELAGRRWIGIDLWDGAMQTTIERFQKTAMLAATDTAVNTMAIIGQLHHRTDVPERTDGGDAAAPYLATPTKGMRRRPLMGVTEMKELLVEKFWLHCWGCNFVAPDARYLELDHIRPRNSGGSDDIDNRALLCGPCNKIKRDHATLVSLRKANEKSGHLAGIHPINLKEAGRWTRRVYEEALAQRLSANA